MWRADGDAELYLYAPYDQSEGFCDRPNYYCNFDKGHSVNRGSFVIQPGELFFYQIIFMSFFIKVNGIKLKSVSNSTIQANETEYSCFSIMASLSFI